MTASQQLDDTKDKPKKTGAGFRGGSENINRNGRPKGIKSKTITNRELRERELLMLLRKIKPHIASSVVRAAAIMNNEEASHMNQLKAATILLDAYRKLTLDLYDGEDDEEEATAIIQEQNPPSGAVFSLRMIGNEEDPK